jgi:hypothetical protein
METINISNEILTYLILTIESDNENITIEDLN